MRNQSARRALLIALMTATLPLNGCVTQPPRPQRTQLEMREMQTRSYQDRDTRMVMKALINALQDDGFMVRNADRDLGFISASKEVDVRDSSEMIWAGIFQGAQARWKSNSIVECSANVSEFGRETKVRAIFQIKVLDNFGAPVTVHQVEDPHFYQDFFARVDKSLFLERSGF